MALNRLFWPPPELPGPFVEICGTRLRKSVKLRLSVGRRAIVESVIVVAMPLCDDDMTAPVVVADDFDASEPNGPLVQREVHAKHLTEGNEQVVRVPRRKSDASSRNCVGAAGFKRRHVIASFAVGQRSGPRAIGAVDDHNLNALHSLSLTVRHGSADGSRGNALGRDKLCAGTKHREYDRGAGRPT